MRILENIINTAPPDSDYLNGRIKNKDLTFSLPGTPIIEEVYGDIIQFFQKLLTLTGITANDVPDNETNGHQTIESLRGFLQDAGLVQYNLFTTIKVGIDTALVGAFSAMCAINDSDIAYINSSDNLLKTYRFDGLDWSQIGNSISPSASFSNVVMCQLDTDKIAFIDATGDQLRTYSWDGTDWTLTGNGLSISIGSGNAAITKIDTNTVAVVIEFTNVLNTYEFDGTDWSLVGNSFAFTNDDPSMAALDVNVVAIYDTNNDELSTYEFDGTDWSLVGNSFSLTASTICHMVKLGTNEILLVYAISNQMRFYRFDGTDWTEKGIHYQIRSGGSPSGGYPVAIMPNKMIVLYNSSDDILTNLMRVIGF